MIIDSHTHYFKTFAYFKGQEPADFVAGFQKLGVHKSIVFTLEGFLHDYRGGNDQLSALQAEFPGAITTWGTVDPRDGDRAVAEVNRCLDELGMTGFKFHTWLQAISAVDPAMFPVMEEIQRRGAPVIFHDGTPPYSTTDQIAFLAGCFPQVSIILGHSGLNDMGRQAQRALMRHNNIYLGICGGRYDTFVWAVQHAGVDRLLFGSDYPFGGSGNITYQMEKVFRLPISDDDKDKILCGNALKLVPSLAG